MIATLNGVISEKINDLIIIDVHGVGYGVLTPSGDYGKLLTGDSAKFYIYEQVRENSYDLYGFIQLDTKKLFEQLLEVTGVGPKMALNILSIGLPDDVRKSIAAGDTKYITAAPGVGKRVAERVVVELKDKVGLVATASDSMFMATTYAEKDEAVQALVALGFTIPDAVASLNGVDEKLPTDQRVKQALKGSAL